MKIENDREHGLLLSILEPLLWGGSTPGRAVKWLAKQIEAYEKKRWPLPRPTRAEARAFRREQERR